MHRLSPFVPGLWRPFPQCPSTCRSRPLLLASTSYCSLLCVPMFARFRYLGFNSATKPDKGTLPSLWSRRHLINTMATCATLLTITGNGIPRGALNATRQTLVVKGVLTLGRFLPHAFKEGCTFKIFFILISSAKSKGAKSKGAYPYLRSEHHERYVPSERVCWGKHFLSLHFCFLFCSAKNEVTWHFVFVMSTYCNLKSDYLHIIE